MKILSIDTASDICGVSILDNNKLLLKSDILTGRTHSENLMPIIERTFKETNLQLKDIDLIVSNIGPGSFTGIRIGISTVKAFCDTQNIPCIGVSSLESLLYNTLTCGIIVSILPATNDDFYFAIYNTQNKPNILTLHQPSLACFNDIINICKKYANENITFIGTSLKNRENQILNKLPNVSFPSNDYNILDSYSLGLAGLNNYKNNNITDVLPLYIKKPQAQIELENKMKGLN